MEMSERKMRILKAIIDDYIATGIPVGSRTLSRRSGFDFSPATIRNEMADLEEMGYLEKIHASAGRTPSDLAYRFYVDRLMQIDSITPSEVNAIREYFSTKVNALDQVIDMAAIVLSETTHHVSMVMRPQMDSIKLKRIQIIKITETKALVVLVTDSGIIKDTVISLNKTIDDRNLEMLSNMLTEKTRDLSLKEALVKMEDIVKNLYENREVADEVISVVSEQAAKKDLVLGGVGHVLDYPEYSESGKAKDFLKLLETKDKLYNMLSATTDMEFTIRIGSENPYDEFKGMSIVTATYKVGGENVGSYGVIGPTRMDYAKVLSVLQYVGRNMNNILSCMLDDEKKGK